MPDLPEQVEHIMIIKGYMAFGTDSPQKIKALLEQNHGIVFDVNTVRTKINDIKMGKYDVSYFDNLLDIHFPDMYAQIVELLSKDLVDLDIMAKDDTNDPKVQLAARKAHAAVSLDLLNTIHKGPVVRMMKQLSTKTKAMARQLVQQEAIIRSRTDKNMMEKDRELYPKMIVLDSQLNEVKDEIDHITTESEKLIDDDSRLGNQ